MRKLSDRLKTIADRINKGETVADIGTDHGQLPVFLYEEGICPRVIMTDISEASLDKARAEGSDHLRDDNAPEGLTARAGDGLAPLQAGEVDTIVMAGIGGILMTEIIASDIVKAASFKKYVLQPRKSAGELRTFLYGNGFRITAEDLVREGKFICEIITAEPVQTARLDDAVALPEGMPAPQYEIPPYYASLENDLVEEYIQAKIEMKKVLEENLGKKKTADEGQSERTKVRESIVYMENLLKIRKLQKKVNG
jgi:tRNA (adenine22-N1)-methyltransferase